MNNLLHLIDKIVYRLQRIFHPDEQQELYNAWFAARGDKTLRLQYPLSHDSLVFDVGGYKGEWAAEIYERFACRIFIFEPVKLYARQIQKRFAGSPGVKVFPYGLGSSDRTATISVDNDSSSLFRHSDDAEEIEIRNVVDFLRTENIVDIDLMKINTEGAEYELLESLLQCGACENIKNLQVQFHKVFPEAEARMMAIQTALGVTHDLTWQYRFIWENWTRKPRLDS
jgi:FkbM family methyltransferase